MFNQVIVFIQKTFVVNLGKFSIPFSYWQAAGIVVLIFLLIVSLAQFRRHEVNFSFKGMMVGLLFGFIFTLILEGFLIINGKTVITQILGWNNAPKPISLVLDAGRTKLTQVLGVSDQTIQSLNPTEIKKLKSLICN